MNALFKRLSSLLFGGFLLMAISASAAVVTATFNTATNVPVTAASYTATGNTVDLALNFAPITGTSLTVVKSTGLVPIQGEFTNLAQGQAVNLTYGGITYPFVANYFGGSGNDLVLQWANTRVVQWGSGGLVPVPMEDAGALSGKTVTKCGTGSSHQVALCADGTLAAWGTNTSGQLGNDSTTNSMIPVAVDRSGVLAQKHVIDVVAGGSHNLALCSDGTLVAWGQNNYGQLGDNSTTRSLVPVEINATGLLAGKRITAVAAGESHTLVLCADGTLAAWGYNNNGQLGNNSTSNSLVPVAVDQGGVLAGKTVVSIAAGASHSLALCADGTLVTWGNASSGELGNGYSPNSLVPVLVNQSGVLAGKTVIAISTGAFHNFALCADGVLAGWGGDVWGVMGDGRSGNRYTPVLVNQTGVLAGKTLSAAFGKTTHSLALFTDGTMAAWGYNSNGQLGNNSTSTSHVPVTVSKTGLQPGERFFAVGSGPSAWSSFALTALLPPPSATTMAAADVKDDGATLRASVDPNGSNTVVTFEYGLTTAYGATVIATPSPVTGTGVKMANTALAGLPAGTTYHYRVIAAGPGGSATGDDMTFTTSTLATLSGLTTGSGPFAPAFEMNRSGYYITVPFSTSDITVTPTLTHASSTVKVNGNATASGSASMPIPLGVGNTTIPLLVTSGDGANTRNYQVVVTRLPTTLAWSSASAVPVTAESFAATGDAPTLVLNHAPQTGAALMVVNNTGSGRIQGMFDNLTDGQRINLDFGGISYPFIANYAGGTGNDLVLEWGNTRLMGWGTNVTGPQSDATVKVPSPVFWTDALAGKTIKDAKAGSSYALALTWDGSLIMWPGNPAKVPYLVQPAGALTGKTVVEIATGEDHNLALCADGTLAAWGGDYRGQLGDGGSATMNTPVLVNRDGILANKEIVGVEAGRSFSVALCSDGTVVEWGWLSGSQFGENSRLPVSMQDRGALVGKKVVELRAGFNNWLALCDDGTLVVWGSNGSGEFGNGTTGYSDDRYAPVTVTMTGALAGKTIQEMALGSGTCLVLCSDGTLVSWGSNSYGQLGIGNKTNSSVPVRVNQTGVLAGKTVVKIFAGQSQCYALCSDGSMAAWGYNKYGGLGNDTTTDSTVPVLVSATNFAAGEKFAWSGGPGSAYNHTLALSAMPPAPTAETLAASGVTDNTVTLRAAVQPNGSATPVTFEYGRTSAYGLATNATPATVSGGGAVQVAANLTNLQPGTTYHYRVLATGPGGTARGEDMTFSTSALATLAGLAADAGSLQPDFTSLHTDYSLTVPSGVAAVVLTPVAVQAGATITVNGEAVASGSASAPVPLGAGNTSIPVVVTAADASTSNSYTVTVTRVPEVLKFVSASNYVLTAEAFDGTGMAPTFALSFAPAVGTELRVVNQTGLRFFRGRFANLEQGQEIGLAYNGIVYRFVADYFGGTGNDLVLHWAAGRLVGTGFNSDGQVGDGSSTSQLMPAAVVGTGVLAGKTVIAVANGNAHTLALCSDGTFAAWGANSSGQLGTGDLVPSKVPVAVDMTGDLAGRRVVAIAAGYKHSLVLCDDGSILGWGDNFYGQVGNSGSPTEMKAVLLEDLGVLAGREVVAISAGQYSNLALCADGLVAAWGSNSNGELGDGTTASRLRPVAVSQAGALAEKTVVRIAAGTTHNLALCADGGLVAWGANSKGQLGTGDVLSYPGPVAVNPVGALAGRTVVEIAAGSQFSLVRCSDNALVSWGSNNGTLGNGLLADSLVPVAVSSTGVLAGKSITHINAGNQHCVVLCADGTLAGWGANNNGVLGTGNTTNALTPVAMSSSGLTAGQKFAAAWTGSVANHTLVLVDSPPLAGLETLAATAVTDTSATLNGLVIPNGSATVTFEYGLTNSYGSVVTALPSPVTGGETAVTATLTGLTPGSIYHFRLKAVNGGGTVTSGDGTFTTTQTAGLANLTLNAGMLSPVFESRTQDYVLTVPFAISETTLLARPIREDASLTVNGAAVTSGTASESIPLAVGTTPIAVVVTAVDGVVTQTYTITVTRLPETMVFHAADEVPLRGGQFAASGVAVNFGLAFAPVAGTNLTVIDNTGSAPIFGTFTNLEQGQAVTLEFGGIVYPFVADYFGGTGNDLILRWGNTRALAWWDNSAGQLGDGTLTRQTSPTPVIATGVLAGKTVIAVSGGNSYSLALTADGSVAAWGANGSGQLGNHTTTSSNVPVAVDTSGVLAGKRVVQIAAGTTHSLALCSDGTLAAWGANNAGQLGIATSVATSLVPVAVSPLGALAGKTVVAIGVGEANSYAVCADGTVAAWGSGRLGNNSDTASSVPVAVETSGALAGKKVIAIDGGSYFCVALCSDGTLAAWGRNSSGQLGDGSRTDSSVPVAVDSSGALAGKTVTQISVGSNHALARCSDGTAVSWGYNGSGQLGNPVGNSSAVPVAMDSSGVLAGKSLTAVAAAGIHSLGMCADSFLATWGPTPTAVDLTGLRPGERFVAIACGSMFNLGIAVSAPGPLATSLAATSVSDTGATLHGRAGGNGSNATVAFEYGVTKNYGSTIAASPAVVSGTTVSDAAVTLTGLLPGTEYHYRIVARNAGGDSLGEDLTFTTGSEASLAGLGLSSGSLMPGFASAIPSYSVTVPFTTDRLTMTPEALRAGVTVTVNGAVVASGNASASIPLGVGNTPISIAVDAGDGINMRIYTVTVTRMPEEFAFDSGSSVPLTVSGFSATGLTASFSLHYPPLPGTVLTVVNNIGDYPIQGRFANLAQGQRVDLSFDGVIYSFVANYYGGTGKDLVLQWAATRLMAWGYNNYGQLGDGSVNKSLVPKEVDRSGVLAGKTVMATSSGSGHSLAVTSDGSVFSWGNDTSGQLGDGGKTASSYPVAVDMNGVLTGKKVTAVAAGYENSLALCADGTLVSWGSHQNGQLGNDGPSNATVPMQVDQTGVLAGKTVVSVASGYGHCLALCADGYLAAWGLNNYGQVGNGSNISVTTPVAVDLTGVLKGKRLVSVAAGLRHTLALCADGTLVAWGDNQYGQVGDNSTEISRLTPVLVDRQGVLAGKTVIAIRAGDSHSMVLCADGTVAAWGRNNNGQIGDGSIINRLAPVAVVTSGFLSGKSITSIMTEGFSSFALCADGSMAAWGANSNGQLGNATTTQSSVPVEVNMAGMTTGERFMAAAGGSTASHSLSIVAMPPRPVVYTLEADSNNDAGATVRGVVHASGQENVEVFFEFGLTDSYGSTVAATPGIAVGTGATAASAALAGLQPDATYHFRIIARSATGTVRGEDMTFTTGRGAALASLTNSVGILVPAFTPSLTEYRLTLTQATAPTLTLTPVVATPAATVSVAGTSVISGTPSAPIPLAVGNHTLEAAVTSPSGSVTQTYRIRVTVMPDVMRFDSPGEVPVRAEGFTGSGIQVKFELGFAPVPGTRLLVVDNTGTDWLVGEFSNLTQGQPIDLAFGGRTYRFLANYRGGTGNDMTLEWAGTRLVGWGSNEGIIGNFQTTKSPVPLATYDEGFLQGKNVIKIASGASHALALCLDGTLAGWGGNGYGQVGNNSTTRSLEPVGVDITGVLNGKVVVAVACGGSHSLALCSDGTLAAWGSNDYGQLGTGAGRSAVPALVSTSGVLAGKSIIAIAAGEQTSYALCSDGSLAAWGDGASGAMGNGSSDRASRPVLVDRSGVLAGKMVVAIEAGGAHALALCSDGTLAAWGSNSSGQLGDDTTTTAIVPVLVSRTGALSGRSIIAMAGGRTHSLVLCSDGTLVAWGSNDNGQLGNGSSTGIGKIPATVTVAGALVGKTVVGVEAGASYSLAQCDDGSVVTWGDNQYGQLGNGDTIDSPVPVAVSGGVLLTGERFIALSTGAYTYTNLAITALPQVPWVKTLAAAEVGAGSAMLHGLASPDGGTLTNIHFEYGPTTEYGYRVAASPEVAVGVNQVGVEAALGNLPPGTTWHYRMRATGPTGALFGDDFTFATGGAAMLENLALGGARLSPAFASRITRYSATVPFGTTQLAVTLTPLDPSANLSVNGTALPAGVTESVVALAVGVNPITSVVISGDETTTYIVQVTRLPETLVFGSANEIPLVADGFTCGGVAVNLALGFSPPVGTFLTLVRNDGGDLIDGSFSNLAQGQTVGIEYDGTVYQFVANYFGGDGNDLVLEWANTHWVGWGYNLDSSSGGGALANGRTGYESRPLLAAHTGVLIGRRILKVSAGGAHSLFLCADGTLAAAGDNGNGQLGINSTTDSRIGVAVDRSGVLANKTVCSIAAGSSFSLALCTDGTLAAWGANSYNQLGDGTTSQQLLPVAIHGNGALAGRRAIAIAAGENQGGALCADGTVVVWGSSWGSLPRRADTSFLAAHGKIVSLQSGRSSFLALCDDGSIFTLAATGVSGPLDVTALSGRKVVAIGAGYDASYALCEDGSVFAWGGNPDGQLGNGTQVGSPVPVEVTRTGPLADSPVVGLGYGSSQGFALCADGRMAAWGWNHWGQIGDGTQVSPRTTPVAVDFSVLWPGERVITPPSSPNTGTMFAQVAAPLPEAITLPATHITKFTANVGGTVIAHGSETRISFEYGTTPAYGMTAIGNPSEVHWKAIAADSSTTLSGLLPGTTYHYRVVASSDSGTVRGADRTFTTISDNARLAGLGNDGGVTAPEFDEMQTEYFSSVPFETTAVSVTALTAHPAATMTINGTPVARGSASDPIGLAVGDNVISVVVTAEDRTTTKTYTLTVNRLPQEFVFNSERDIPVTANGFTAGGNPVIVRLNFAPVPGTILTMVNNTQLGFINGRFGNLAQGQRVGLAYGGKVYDFVANYFGGTGNDLVLQWASTELAGWGNNNYGQLGDGGTVRRLLPTRVDATGVLAGKTIVAVSTGYLHSLALCSDGTLASWGYNVYGQLGNDGNAASSVALEVDRSGALAGKTVIAISAGPFHNLALCSDGSIAAWGYNNYGQLGTGDKITQRTPALVVPAGALAGKQVVGIAAGAYHSFARCADGSVVTWGYNDEGELGDNSTTSHLVPVAVDASGALAGKKITSIFAGQYHTLALCTDGTLVAWGYNQHGELGNDTVTSSQVPIAINSFGALAGKTISTVAAGGSHSLALCTDGTLAAWGLNNKTQLGVGGIGQSTVPVTVATSGKTIAMIAVGGNHSMARFTDGSLAAWGDNANGQLGNGTTATSEIPSPVDSSAMTPGSRFMSAATGSASLHSLAIVGLPRSSAASGIQSFDPLADQNHDGIPNLIVRAFALDPTQNSSRELPQPQRIGDNYVIEFTEPKNITNITYGAEFSVNLKAGSWVDIPDSGSGSRHIFRTPADDTKSIFFRLKVSE